MRRGRPKSVGSALGDVTGRVGALGAGVMRVLSEVSAGYNKPIRKKARRRAAEGGAAASGRKTANVKRGRKRRKAAEKPVGVTRSKTTRGGKRKTDGRKKK